MDLKAIWGQSGFDLGSMPLALMSMFGEYGFNTSGRFADLLGAGDVEVAYPNDGSQLLHIRLKL